MKQVLEHISPHVALQHDECHIWLWPLLSATKSADLTEKLDNGERERATRFVYERDRRRYMLCHARMRQLLAGYAGIAEEEVRYRNNAFGKPELEIGRREISFSLSHTGTHGMLAAAAEGAVGADIEDVRSIEPDVASANFSLAELREMEEMEGREWLRSFYRCWTSKEAILKGEGVGLNVPLDSFDVQAREDKPAALLAWRPEAGLRRQWTLHDVSFGDSVVAAVALSGAIRRLRCFYWE